jgi:hypothetical protein
MKSKMLPARDLTEAEYSREYIIFVDQAWVTSGKRFCLPTL